MAFSSRSGILLEGSFSFLQPNSPDTATRDGQEPENRHRGESWEPVQRDEDVFRGRGLADSGTLINRDRWVIKPKPSRSKRNWVKGVELKKGETVVKKENPKVVALGRP